MTKQDQIQRTIVSLGETMIAFNGKGKRSRLMWRAAGLDVFVIGELSGAKYEQAANLACNIALEMHIPLISLRYQGKKPPKKNDTTTKEIF